MSKYYYNKGQSVNGLLKLTNKEEVHFMLFVVIVMVLLFVAGYKSGYNSED